MQNVVLLLFTCGCDLTPIVEQPILETQKRKKMLPVPYGPTLTAAHSVLCSFRRSRYPWVMQLVANPHYDQPTIVTQIRAVRAQTRELQKKLGELRESYLTCLAEAKVLHRVPHLKGEKICKELYSRTTKELTELIKRGQKKHQYQKIGQSL